ncbi:hypothetical protein L1049_021092 [Liquidambar formosana]|uniref:EF-hand domain-containing protein n=1 Tax=Liquidambar formosana TaxID=63359 RepID=A0AAP0S914_LIQFO
MSDGGITVLDGTHLLAIDLSLPESDFPITGAQVLELAESRASSALFGLSLPENLKSSALKRLNLDDEVSFRYDPLVVSILDGNTLRLFLEDEDDFAMLAENLFTDLDTDDKGKISKSEIQNALVHMGVEMGIPPFSEFPLLNDILKKHGAEGKGELGQAQFAELLQPILQELADALTENHVVVIQNVKIINGSKLRKLLVDEKQLNDVIEKIWQEKHCGNDGQRSTELIRGYLEKNGKELGLPPSEANEAVVLLYDAVFADVDSKKSAVELEKDEFGGFVKEILQNFSEQLEANPVFHDLDN